MKKIDISTGYIEALQHFTEMVEKQRGLNIVYSQSGRKYDRVIERMKNSQEHILFFVERATGTIYGRKNDITPNMYWWFNTIYTANLWDWRAWPTPVRDKSVEVVFEYGKEIRHYAPVGKAKSPTKKHKALDMEKVGV